MGEWARNGCGLVVREKKKNKRFFNQIEMNASVIERSLKAKTQPGGLPEYSLRQNLKGINKDLWKRFGIVVKSNKDLDFVACFKCSKVYTFKSTTGTNTILQIVIGPL